MNEKPYKKKRVFLDKKASMIVYALTLAIAVVCRTLQLAENMDFGSGKYIESKFNSTVCVLIVGFALIIAVMLFGESRDKAIKSCILLNPMRLKPERLNKKISPKAAASMFVMAALLAYEVISELIATGTYNKSLSTEENPVSVFAGITVSEWISYGLMIVLVFTFVSTGVNVLKGTGITKENCFFLTLFPIWKLLDIFILITTYQVIGPYSEKCYILLSDMAAAVFFLNLVRFFSGFEKKSTRYLMIIFGYIASILAAVSVIPRYIMYFIMDYSVREGMLSPAPSDIGIIFVTITIAAVFWSTYVYRVMPRLNLTGKRRWSGLQSEGGKNEMKDITDN
jgi:hypothetical protein